MTIRDLLAAEQPTLSYELFPPRTPAAEEALPATMEVLARPAPTSCRSRTALRDRRAARVAALSSAWPRRTPIPPLAHLTCVDQSRAELIAVIEDLPGRGRARLPRACAATRRKGQADWRPHPDGLLYASRARGAVARGRRRARRRHQRRRHRVPRPARDRAVAPAGPRRAARQARGGRGLRDHPGVLRGAPLRGARARCGRPGHRPADRARGHAARVRAPRATAPPNSRACRRPASWWRRSKRGRG